MDVQVQDAEAHAEGSSKLEHADLNPEGVPSPVGQEIVSLAIAMSTTITIEPAGPDDREPDDTSSSVSSAHDRPSSVSMAPCLKVDRFGFIISENIEAVISEEEKRRRAAKEEERSRKWIKMLRSWDTFTSVSGV